ncbi:hypothetical protein Dimus_016027 [Dionaea muscipula]
MDDGGASEKSTKGASDKTILVTCYVSNLPEDMDGVWLKQFFGEFGMVRDAFIPRKRSNIGVKLAAYSRTLIGTRRKDAGWAHQMKPDLGRKNHGRQELAEESKRDKTLHGTLQKGTLKGIDNHKVQQGISYVEAVRMGGQQPLVVKVNSIGNGWLYRSVVATFADYPRPDALFESFVKEEGCNVTIRRMGNKQILVSFPSNDAIRWLAFWFSSVVPWSVNMVNNFGREVCLCCYGVPVHAWNVKTFDAIARNWGKMIQFEEDTVNGVHFDVGKVKIFTRHVGFINQLLNLEVGLLSFPIRVAEEQSVYICNSCADCKCCNYADSVIPVANKNHSKEEDAVVESSNTGNEDWNQGKRVNSLIDASGTVSPLGISRDMEALISAAHGSVNMDGSVSRVGNSLLSDGPLEDEWQEKGRGVNGEEHNKGNEMEIGKVGLGGGGPQDPKECNGGGPYGPREGRLLLCLGQNLG